MPTESHILDHSSQDATRTAVELWDAAAGIEIKEAEFPAPPHKVEYATSVDTEGGLRADDTYENREIKYTLIVSTGTSTITANLNKLTEKVGLIQREGGTLRRSNANGGVVFFDLTNAEIDVPVDWRYILRSNIEVELRFEALPFAREVEYTETVTNETRLPVIRKTVKAIPGDVPALGRMIVTDTQAVDQWMYQWGVRQHDKDETIYSDMIVADTPLLYWRLGETTGTTAADTSGNGRTGTYAGGYTLNREGALHGDTNVAVEFDGTNGRVTSTYDPFANGTVGTLTGWAWRDTNATADTLVAGDGVDHPYLWLEAGSEQVFFRPNVNGIGGSASWPAAWPGNAQWVHWAMVFDEPGDLAKLYINGALVSSETLVMPYGAASGNVEIGARGGTTDPFDGKIDEFAIFGVELTADQVWEHYSQGANALFYEAESRTPLNGAAVAAGPSGASGTGSNTIRHTNLFRTQQAILSTQASGGGSHLSHVGSYRVYARVQRTLLGTLVTSADGDIVLAWEWSIGDYRDVTRNAEVTLDTHYDDGTARLGPLASNWLLVDLGEVHIPKAVSGSQRWGGRLLARIVGEGFSVDLYVDYLVFIPIDESSGQVDTVRQLDTMSTLSAWDEFHAGTAALTGLALDYGGTWVGAGDADDFQENASGGGLVTRTAVSDVNTETGRYAIAGTTVLTDSVAQISFQTSAVAGRQGLLLRYTDVNNWLRVMVSVVPTDATSAWYVDKYVAGVKTTLHNPNVASPLSLSTWYRMRFAASSMGMWWLWYATATGTFSLIASGWDSALATGGALASGKVGFYDVNASTTAATRTYDGFYAAASVKDAAIFASQSLEVRHNSAIREDPSGTTWNPPSSYEGDYFTIRPAGNEGRPVEIIGKASRGDSVKFPDSAIDDISLNVGIQPRWLHVPD